MAYRALRGKRFIYAVAVTAFVGAAVRPTNARAGSAGTEIAGVFSQPRAAAAGPRTVAAAADGLARLARARGSVVLRGVPVSGGSVEDFALEPIDLFTPTATVVASDGRPLQMPAVSQFAGTGLSDPRRDAFISVTGDGEAFVLVRKAGQVDTVIQPDRRSVDRQTYLLLDDAAALPSSDMPLCGGALDAPGGAAALPDDGYVVASGGGPRSNTTLEAEVMLDVGYDLYSGVFLQSDLATTLTYIGNLIGAVSYVYRRDANVVLKVSYLQVWTTPDPFDAPTRENQLNLYQAWLPLNRAAVPRATAHLLKGQASFGGVAYVNVLCNPTFGVGVSNMTGSAAVFPNLDYTYDIFLVSHEIGHNFSAQHTHCYVPPIDRCYNLEACYTGSVVPAIGEIMTYCLQRRLYFGDRIRSDMRTAAEAASCLSAAPGRCGNGILEGGEGCDDGNADDSDCCSNTCVAQNAGVSCSDGFNCTDGDTCDAGGTCVGTPNAGHCNDGTACTEDMCVPGRGCVHTPTPPALCRQAQKSSVSFTDHLETVKNRLTWRWNKGAATLFAELGDPANSTDYAFCIADGAGRTVIAADVPADALKWKLKTRRGDPVGYAYRDAKASADGVASFKLQSGAADAAKASVVGKGFRLGPNNVVPLVEPVRVWIANDATGICWGSDFNGAQIRLNGFGKFKAKAP